MNTVEAYRVELFETAKTITILRFAPESRKDDLREQLTAQFEALPREAQQVILGRYPDLVNL